MAIDEFPNWADVTAARIADCGLRHIAVNIGRVRNVGPKIVLGSVFGSNKGLMLVSFTSRRSRDNISHPAKILLER
jgi:hypothetical protein